MRTRQFVILGAGCLLFCTTIWAQGAGAAKPAAGQSLSAVASPSTVDNLLNGGPVAWNQVAVKHIGLNRTPPLYDTDEPAALDIPAVDVRLARAGGKLLVQLSWRDATHDLSLIHI